MLVKDTVKVSLTNIQVLHFLLYCIFEVGKKDQHEKYIATLINTFVQQFIFVK